MSVLPFPTSDEFRRDPLEALRAALQAVVDAPTPEEIMPTTNPYERRDVDRPVRLQSSDFTNLTVHREGLHVDDLHAMIASAVDRGRAAAAAELLAIHVEHLERARRVAWDEGHAVGAQQADSAAFVDYLGAVKDRFAAIDAVLVVDEPDADRDPVALAEELRATRALLERTVLGT